MNRRLWRNFEVGRRSAPASPALQGLKVLP
jgi:hypothetical protein